MLNILMKVVWVLNIFAQVDLLVNHHLREHEDDQDASRVHWGAFKSTIEIFFPCTYIFISSFHRWSSRGWTLWSTENQPIQLRFSLFHDPCHHQQMSHAEHCKASTSNTIHLNIIIQAWVEFQYNKGAKAGGKGPTNPVMGANAG